jgi:hypothetical protein
MRIRRRRWPWVTWIAGSLLVIAVGCDGSPDVEIPDNPTEMPTEPPAASRLPPPPPPQY